MCEKCTKEGIKEGHGQSHAYFVGLGVDVFSGFPCTRASQGVCPSAPLTPRAWTTNRTFWPWRQTE